MQGNVRVSVLLISLLQDFDKYFSRPAVCQQTDPNQPYCQILGKHPMTHPGYSTVKPYDHMSKEYPEAKNPENLVKFEWIGYISSLYHLFF